VQSERQDGPAENINTQQRSEQQHDIPFPVANQHIR
jgi:hypothetical protein